MFKEKLLKRKNLIPFVVLMFLMCSGVFTPSAKAVEIGSDVYFYGWIVTSEHSYLTTTEESLIYNEADANDPNKGTTLNIPYEEGSEISLNIVMTNGKSYKITVELWYGIEYKVVGEDDWHTYDFGAFKGDIDAGKSKDISSKTQDLTTKGWWSPDVDIHLVYTVIWYPTTNPSQKEWAGFSLWIKVIQDSGTSNGEENGAEDSTSDGATDGTTGDGGEEKELTFWQRIFKFFADFFDFIAKKFQELFNISS